MNQPGSPNQPAPDGSSAEQAQALLASFLAGEWSPQNAAACADLLSAWRTLEGAGEHDLPSLLELTADLDALGLAEEQGGQAPAWVQGFNVDAALERARRDAARIPSAPAPPHPMHGRSWRPWALAAAALLVTLLGLRLRAGAGGSSGDDTGKVPIFGNEQQSGALVIAVDPTGARHLVTQGIPEELDDVKRWLRVEIQADEEGQTWSTIYSGELGSGGFPIDEATEATQLRWRGTLQVPGELDARWSSGWRYSD